MLTNAVNISLSGIKAAEKRIAASADNIANISSTFKVVDKVEISEPFTPKQVVQTSLDSGGVKSSIIDSDKEPVAIYNPSDPATDENGVVLLPNVSISEEIVQQTIAKYDYLANLKILDVADDMRGALFDILS